MRGEQYGAENENARPWEKNKNALNFSEQLMVMLGAMGAGVLIWLVFAVAAFIVIFAMTSYFGGLLQ